MFVHKLTRPGFGLIKAITNYAQRHVEQVHDRDPGPPGEDVTSRLEEHQMIVVTRYPNAVLTGWHLPYNVRPKRDWPLEAL